MKRQRKRRRAQSSVAPTIAERSRPDRVAYRQAELAEMLGVGVHTIYRRLRAGTQEHVRIAPATAVVPHWWLAAELGANGGGDLVPALLKESAPVSVHDAADLLGVSVWSVRRGLNMGLIPSGASDGREAVPALSSRGRPAMAGN